MIASDSPKTAVFEARTGWIEDGKAFVRTDGVIGKPSLHVLGIQRLNKQQEPSGRLTSGGTWQTWRDTVATHAKGSSSMMLAICAACTGPLMAVVNHRSFMLNLYAATRTGKSVATLVGASMGGTKSIDALMTWRLTDNRLEERLPEYNDALFPIDDLKTMPEQSNAARLARIQGIAYGHEQGYGKGRSNAFTMGQGGTHESWRCIGFTSNELSIRDMARAAKTERQGGEVVRLIDVPARLKGLEHIFDRLPEDKIDGNFADWKTKEFKKIVAACEANHGKAFEKYIECLIADGGFTLAGQVRDLASGFAGRVCDKFDGDIARDVASKFGLLYAGGSLGIKYGLLPWTMDELFDALQQCFLGASALLPDDGVELRNGVAALRSKVGSLPWASEAKRVPTEVDGYREGWGANYVIKRDAFNRLFGSIHQRDLVLASLINSKHIELADPKRTGGGPRAPKDQHEWPDGQRHRSYRLLGITGQ